MVMRSTNRRRFWAVPLVLFTAGAALAQGGDVDLKKGASLSPQQTVTEAHDYQTKMRATQLRVEKLVDTARKQKDVIKLNCVNDKMVRIRGHMTVADQTMASLDTAIGRNDGGARQHEFTRLIILFQKVQVLGTEAENCIGEDVSYVGDTKVEVEIDPNIPDDDPTQPLLPVPDVNRPPEASPFV
jgi:hypothetical protein